MCSFAHISESKQSLNSKEGGRGGGWERGAEHKLGARGNNKSAIKTIEPYCFYHVHAVFISHATAYKNLKFNIIISTFSIGMVESEGMLHWHILLLT